MGKSWIPAISNTKLADLCARIRPIVTFPDLGKRYIRSVDPRNDSYIWDPTATNEAVEGIAELQSITTYHTFGFYGLFKPSIAEVIAQIPEELLSQVVAFEIIKSPETADDLKRERKATAAGYHVAVTMLYKKA